MKKVLIPIIAIGGLVSVLVACNNGSSTSTYQYLQVVSNTNPAVYRADVGQSSTMVFTNMIVSNAGPAQAKYNITATVPNSSFTVLNESGNNGCAQVLANQACNITIVFTPTSTSSYAATNLIQFSVGALESSINVVTAPKS